MIVVLISLIVSLSQHPGTSLILNSTLRVLHLVEHTEVNLDCLFQELSATRNMPMNLKVSLALPAGDRALKFQFLHLERGGVNIYFCQSSQRQLLISLSESLEQLSFYLPFIFSYSLPPIPIVTFPEELSRCLVFQSIIC